MAQHGSRPADLALTRLGVLQKINSPYYKFLEFHQRMRIWRLLAEDWGSMQGASDLDALAAWQTACEVLELDAVSIEDLFLLVAQGPPGRAEANEILWKLLAEFSLSDPPHRDLSRKCSSMVTEARHRIDRPPRHHGDRAWWTWKKAIYPRDEAWSSAAVGSWPGAPPPSGVLGASAAAGAGGGLGNPELLGLAGRLCFLWRLWILGG